MHPILARRSTTFAYAAVWVAVGFSLTGLEGLSFLSAGLLAVPLLLVYGFICLTPWYLCRLMPIRPDTALRVVPMQVLAGLVSASLWMLIVYAWTALLSTTSAAAEVTPAFARIRPLFFSLGVVVFLLSSAVHYLMVAVDQSRAAETIALRHQMLAAQAELRALRAQITPHFLFNSLNSISALTSTDPVGARRMCILLGDFLRGTLQVGSLDRIPLSQELALVDQFLQIEQVRFGARLRVERAVEPDTLVCAVPPLILQPLAENAIRHGLGQLIDGGVVRIDTRLREGRLILSIENPVEGRPRRGGSGLGLENVRRRLDAAFGREADMTSGAADGVFRVVVTLPRAAMEKAMTQPVSGALRVLVVDDEALARQVLREYLEGIADVEVLGECANGFDAVKAIAERGPDLVFLDVQMPKLDGFEVLELAGRATPVVFVTAYDEFAVRAFEVHAIDYLLKPISPERVGEAIDRARARLGRPAEPVPVAALRAEGRAQAPLERILVRDGTRVHVIDLDDLDFVQAQDDYVCFHAAGKEYLKEQPLAEVEELLDASRFVRIHRSFILNIERIARVEPLTRDSRIVILKDGRRLPISRTGYQRLTALM